MKANEEEHMTVKEKKKKEKKLQTKKEKKKKKKKRNTLNLHKESKREILTHLRGPELVCGVRARVRPRLYNGERTRMMEITRQETQRQPSL